MLQAQAQDLEGSSQLSERQANRKFSSTKGQGLKGTFQLSERQPRSFKGPGTGPAKSSSLGANGLQLIHAEGQTVLRNRQSLPFDGQSRPYQDTSDRYSHAHFGKPEHQQLQQSIGHRHRAATTAPSLNSALPTQADPAEQTLHSMGGLTNMQIGPQKVAKPANSQRSVNQQPSQPHQQQSALVLMSQAGKQSWLSGDGVGSELVSMGMTPLAGDEGGPEQHASAPCGDNRELSQRQPGRHVLSHMRGISPQRRQLLLQARVALFDSDSSSDEEGCPVQKVS